MFTSKRGRCDFVHQLVKEPHSLEVNMDIYDEIKGATAFNQLVSQMKEKAKQLAPKVKHGDHDMKSPLGYLISNRKTMIK